MLRTKKDHRDLLVRTLDELKNLEQKVNNGEPAGWEGVRRRVVLKADITDAIQLLLYDVT